MLTAQDIHEKDFARGRKGYDMDEVDAFLDEVVNDFDLLSRENQELNARIEALNKQIESYRGMENSMMHTMVTVHKAAEDITDKAKREADELYTKTRHEADEMVERARTESEQMLADAKEKAEAILQSKQDEIQMHESRLVELKSLLAEFKNGLHTYTSEFLEFVDKEEAPAEVDALEQKLQAEEAAEVEPAKEVEPDYVQEYVRGIHESQAALREEDVYRPVEVDAEDDHLYTE